jgi:outer membrane immunogenic protein
MKGMTMKKLIALAAIAPIAMLSATAHAEGRWDGIYGGVHAGAAWQNGDMTAYTPYNSYEGFPVAGMNDSGFIGGVQLGYNHQMGNVVVGIEAGATLAGLEKAAYTPIDGTDTAPDDKLFYRKSNFNATLAPRVGYVFGPVLVSAKGGLAIANSEVGHDQNGTMISAKDTLVGYVLGAGADYALNDKISVGVAYEYQSYKGSRQHVTGPSSDIFIKQGGDFHIAKVAVNYQF